MQLLSFLYSANATTFSSGTDGRVFCIEHFCFVKKCGYSTRTSQYIWRKVNVGDISLEKFMKSQTRGRSLLQYLKANLTLRIEFA